MRSLAPGGIGPPHGLDFRPGHRGPFSGTRDIFPFALLREPMPPRPSQRRAQQRLCHRQQHVRRVNDTLRRLNWLSGCHEKDAGGATANRIQREVLERVDGLVNDFTIRQRFGQREPCSLPVRP
eukprot:16436999-Heterocapsa_arctica.AAC.1